MKNKLNKMLAAGALSVMAGYAGTALATSSTVSSQAIGAASNATDLYQVTCASLNATLTSRLDVYLKDNTAGTSILSLQVLKGLMAKSVTDPKGGDAVVTPVTSLLGGNGIYTIIVDKTIAGARTFDVTASCMTGANAQSPTSIVRWQVQ